MAQETREDYLRKQKIAPPTGSRDPGRLLHPDEIAGSPSFDQWRYLLGTPLPMDTPPLGYNPMTAPARKPSSLEAILNRKL